MVHKFGPTNTVLYAVVTLLGSYYACDDNYPSGFCKNMYIFLEYKLLGKTCSSIPIEVEIILAEIK